MCYGELKKLKNKVNSLHGTDKLHQMTVDQETLHMFSIRYFTTAKQLSEHTMQGPTSKHN